MLTTSLTTAIPRADDAITGVARLLLTLFREYLLLCSMHTCDCQCTTAFCCSRPLAIFTTASTTRSSKRLAPLSPRRPCRLYFSASYKTLYLSLLAIDTPPRHAPSAELSPDAARRDLHFVTCTPHNIMVSYSIISDTTRQKWPMYDKNRII